MNGLAPQQTWQTAPEKSTPANDELHVWLVQFDRENGADFFSVLSDDERARADRFRFEKDRNNFIIGRGFLRKTVSRYLQIKPEKIEFEYNRFGKPFLPSTLKFNLSHSGNFALLAVGLNHEIGIDIEQNAASFIDDGVISLCLTKKEKARFYSLSDDERLSFFFACWTHKEAYLKAHGFGLSVSPNEIETSELRQSDFTFPEIPVIDGYSSALAINGKKSQIKFYTAESR